MAGWSSDYVIGLGKNPIELIIQITHVTYTVYIYIYIYIYNIYIVCNNIDFHTTFLISQLQQPQ